MHVIYQSVKRPQKWGDSSARCLIDWHATEFWRWQTAHGSQERIRRSLFDRLDLRLRSLSLGGSAADDVLEIQGLAESRLLEDRVAVPQRPQSWILRTRG